MLSPIWVIANEYQECKAFWQWAQNYEVTREFLIKNANENQSKNWFRRALIAIGMRPGLPDYHLPVANAKYIGLWIEVKTVDQKNKKKREEQDEWINKLNQIGHFATYVYGAQDAINVTTKYLKDQI